MIAHGVLCIGLLGLSGWLIDHHRRAGWDTRHDPKQTVRKQRFARAQFWRRMVVSSTIAVVGLLIPLHPFVPAEPLPMMVYLTAMFVATAVILLGGVADAYAGARHYREDLRRHRRRQVRRLAVETLQVRQQHAAKTNDDTQA